MFGGSRSIVRGMAGGMCYSHACAQATFIAKRDGIPAARLTHDAEIRLIHTENAICTTRRWGFFLDTAHYRDASSIEAGRVQTRCCGDKRRQRSFGIDRATSIQFSILDPNWYITCDRIDMSQQDDMGCASSNAANSVSDRIDVGLEAQPLHCGD
jgi:hypothetical protein